MKGPKGNVPAILLLLLGFGASVYAQPEWNSPPGKWWKDRRVIEHLKLTQDQQARIESLWLEDRRNLIDQKAELDKGRVDLAEILSKDSGNESAALRAFEKVQAARAALERSTFLMRLRIKNTLSTEQQQKLEEISAQLQHGQGFGRNRPRNQRVPAPPPPPTGPQEQ